MAKYKRGSLALARRVFNTPQLIIESDLNRIAEFLVDRANGVEFNVDEYVKESEKETLSTLREMSTYTTEEEKQKYHKKLGITNEGKRGHLNIEGSLVAKAGEIGNSCMELTSYEKLLSTFQMQVREGISELVLNVDSGGGEAFSLFEMANEIKSLADKHDIKIYAYVDGMSASAAYALTSIADEVVARPDSEIGSIGVVVQLVNNSKMLQDIGITRKFITYGENKVPFDEDGQFTEKFISSLQKRVDKMGLEFTTFVAKNRNMNVEDVIATQAEVFDTDEALRLGLIDKIMTRSQFFNEYLPMASSASNTSKSIKLKTEETMTLEEIIKQAAEAGYTVVEMKETQTLVELSEFTTIKEQAESFTELSGKLETATTKIKELEDQIALAQADALIASRKTKLEDVLGTENEQVSQILSATAGLDDTAFELICQGYSASFDRKEKEFTEKGMAPEKEQPRKSLEDIVKARLAETN